MGDLISRSELIAKIKPPTEDDYTHTIPLGNVRKMLLNFANSVPSVDAVEVVHCKDCKHFVEPSPYDPCECMKWTIKWGRAFVQPNDFCSYGERERKGDDA